MSAELFSVKTIKFKNTGTKTKGQDGKVRVSKDTVRVEIMGHEIEVPFDGELDVPELYTRPSLCVNGSRGLSPIEQLAPQLEPSDPEWATEWRKAPVPAQPAIQPGKGPAAPVTVESLMASGLSRGLAEQMYNAIQQARVVKTGG